MLDLLDTDQQLVQRVRGGDASAFAVLARRHLSWLVATCARHLGGDHHLAEDVAQECLLKLHAALVRDERPLAVQAWLAVVARHACIDQLRRRTPVPYDELPDTPVEPEDPFDVDPALALAWERLAPRHREVLTHRELVGLSYEETALAMATTVPAVETLLFRARASLRKHYRKAGGRLLGCGAYLFGLERLARGPQADPHAAAHVATCASCRDALQHAEAVTHLLRGVVPSGPRAGSGRLAELLGRTGDHVSAVLSTAAGFGGQVGTALTAAAVALAPAAAADRPPLSAPAPVVRVVTQSVRSPSPLAAARHAPGAVPTLVAPTPSPDPAASGWRTAWRRTPPRPAPWWTPAPPPSPSWSWPVPVRPTATPSPWAPWQPGQLGR